MTERHIHFTASTIKAGRVISSLCILVLIEAVGFVAELLQVRSSIPIQCVCAVERVDENAFQQQNVMQLITQNNDRQLHIIYIQCKVTGPVCVRLRAFKTRKQV